MSDEKLAATELAKFVASPRVKASRFRAAYEALIEPLVNATVKVAEAETEHQILRAQFGSLQAEIAALQAQVATLQAEIGTLQARLASSQTERAQLVEQLQAVYQSHSWRVT
jgi:uncharacterized protein YlxW (UPF0749 family)